MADTATSAEIEAAAERLRRSGDWYVSHILALDESPHLCLFVSVWPLLKHPKPKIPMKTPPHDLQNTRDWLWGHYRYNPERIIRQVKLMLGPHFPVSQMLDQAKELTMILPDGIVVKTAEGYIKAVAQHKLKGFK